GCDLPFCTAAGSAGEFQNWKFRGGTHVSGMYRKRSGSGSRSRVRGWNPGGVHHQVQEVFQGEWSEIGFEEARRDDMATSNPKERLAMNTPPVVSRQEWETARQQLLVKEKAFTRSRDALAAERRRMPRMAVEKNYEFDGPKGKVSLLDLFEGRRQLIVYRAFFELGVFGWPEHACRGCSLGADQVSHLSHLNAR